MVLQKLWISQNFSRISRVSQSRFLSGYVRLAVSFFKRRCLGVSKHFEFSVLQSKKSKCLRLAKKNASLAVSQSLAFTIRHPYNRPTNNCMLLSNIGFLLSCLIWKDISIPLCIILYILIIVSDQSILKQQAISFNAFLRPCTQTIKLKIDKWVKNISESDLS